MKNPAHLLACVVALSVGCQAASSDEPVSDAASPDGGPEADAGAEDGPSAPTDGGSDAGAARPFEAIGKEPEACPLARCSGWPTSAQGVVYRYRSRETFGGKVLERTFHVFVPRAATASSPVVVALHGGNGSGPAFLTGVSWLSLATAAAEGLTWEKNSDTCRALPTTEERGVVFRAPDGETPCAPSRVTVTNEKPFILVLPDGVLDEGSSVLRHWEDGRVPSPGFGTATPNRDDVGFIEHVLEVVLGDTSLPVDRSALYLTGVSNGGMMALRAATTIGDAKYPNLAKLAAVVAFVADLPEPLALPAPTVSFGLALHQGTAIPTPNCDTPGCTTPIVLGDGRMPFGQPGGVYFVNSPDRGAVRSGPDTIAAWQAAFGEGVTTEASMGTYAQRATTRFPSGAVVESWVTTGGGHTFLASRQDVQPLARGWAFLSSFARGADGALHERPVTWMNGVY